MATATVNTETVTKEVTEEIEVRDGVNLELDHVETVALSIVLNRIGGDTNTTLRGVTERIKDALAKQGYKALSPENCTMEGNRAIYFSNPSLTFAETFPRPTT